MTLQVSGRLVNTQARRHAAAGARLSAGRRVNLGGGRPPGTSAECYEMCTIRTGTVNDPPIGRALSGPQEDPRAGISGCGSSVGARHGTARDSRRTARPTPRFSTPGERLPSALEGSYDNVLTDRSPTSRKARRLDRPALVGCVHGSDRVIGAIFGSPTQRRGHQNTPHSSDSPQLSAGTHNVISARRRQERRRPRVKPSVPHR